MALLACACANGDLEQVESLLKSGTKPNESSLGTAITCFQPEVIKLLLKYGADPNGIVCSEFLQLSGYMYPLDLAQYCSMNSYMTSDATDVIYKILLENGSVKINRYDCLNLQWMMEEIQMEKEKRIKERTSVYFHLSSNLPHDVSRMVAECF